MRTLFFLYIIFFPLALLGQFKSGEDVFINQPYDDDLYVAGGTVTVSTIINGDLVIAGGDIFISDSIHQDLIIAGGNISVNGVIGDDIRCAGGKINIEGIVTDDVIVFGGEVTIDQDAQILGNLLIFGGKVKVLGNITGNMKASAGEIDVTGNIGQNLNVKSGEFTLKGKVEGSAVIASEDLYITPDAQIKGNLDYWTGDGPIEISERTVDGVINYLESLRPENYGWDWRIGGAVFLILSVMYVLAAFLIILVLELVFSKQFTEAIQSWKRDLGSSLGYGMIYILGVPIAIVFLIAIVIGIPIGLFLLSFYIFTIAFGISIASLLFVNYFNESQDLKWNKATIIILAVVTVIFIRFITFIPIVGWLLEILIIAAAFGAFIQLWLGKRKKLKVSN